ncbi:MAG: TetR/AcrR family transcriptional regulator [Acidimicrobiales bacterium]
MSRAAYHSERRQEQAEATRQAILDAARTLFVERGYARTTIADIASLAHVAVPTVYVSVGPKPSILGELRKQIPVLAGVPENARAAFDQVNDPRRVISGFVAGVRRLLETSGGLMYAIESAAPFEPVAAEAWEEGLVLHRAVCGVALERLEALGALSGTLSLARAGDVMSLMTLPATWRTLGANYGWTYDDVEAWMVESVMVLVTDRH